MIEFKGGGRMVTDLSELPPLTGAKHLYLDLETTSGDKKKDSLDPWRNCEILGVSVTADDAPGSWYAPIAHHQPRYNLPRDNVMAWLKDMLATAKCWTNHNVKYDAHVTSLAGAPFGGRLFCTMTHAKIILSDRLRYNLTALSADWLGIDIRPYEERIEVYTKLAKNKDYGAVPADVMAEYACWDVNIARLLHLYEEKNCPEQCRRVWETETDLTSVLFDMEQTGMTVNPSELMITQYRLFDEMLKLEESIHQLSGMPVRPHVNTDCYDLLCNRYGLPVLGWTHEDKNGNPTEEANPSFDKEALQSYLRHPIVVDSPDIHKVVSQLLKYRKAHTLNTYFVVPYATLNIDGVMHPQYNQAVRTGRMSCKKPNAQQLSPAAKMLVHPAAGYGFLSADYSQIEFRLIVHYLNNVSAIAAYAANPDTDFHDWVAKMCEIKRKPAKNINFCIAFGGGKRRVTRMLASNMDLVGTLIDVAKDMKSHGDDDSLESIFAALATRRANEVYGTYHERLPELKRQSYNAAMKIQSRGYVFNAHGRRRHLPLPAAFRALNAVIQSDAADVMKERTVATSPRFNPWVREQGILQTASVHDETLYSVPLDRLDDPRVSATLGVLMECVSPIEYRVPIRVNMSRSAKSWGATGEERVVDGVKRKVNEVVLDRSVAVCEGFISDVREHLGVR